MSQERENALVRLQKSRVQLLYRQPFLGALAMRLEIHIEDDARVPTSESEGDKMRFGRHYVARSNDSECLYMVAHQVWHCAAGHAARQGARQKHYWDLACDHEVHSALHASQIRVPSGAFWLPERKNKSAEQIYDDFMKDQEANIGLPGHDRSFAHQDTHAGWHRMKTNENAEQPALRHAQSTALIDMRWAQSIEAIYRARKSLVPGELRGLVDQVIQGQRTSRVDWRQHLEQFLVRNLSPNSQWTPPNRRYIARGIYLPSRRSPQLCITVALDISESTQDDLPRFFAEVQRILSTFPNAKVVCLQADTEVRAEQNISIVDIRKLKNCQGGGGTDLRPAFKRAEALGSSALVYFTDGQGPVPEVEPHFPTLWALTGTRKKPTPWGEAGFLSNE